MEGFFVTINCSKILDSNETSYKVFIDKKKMSIVYELIEWIRFMLSLEGCFFLIHENSVIHELEDIQVLEVLKALEIRPCLRPNCIHQKLNKTLFSKLNVYTYLNEVRVHTLFQARWRDKIQKPSDTQQNYLDINKKSNDFSSKPLVNFFQEVDKSKLIISQHEISSPSKLGDNIENGTVQVTDTTKEQTNKNFSKLKEPNTSMVDENDSENNFNSDGCNRLTESSFSGPVNKKPKIQSEQKNSGKKNSRRIEVPFTLGALLSEIREKAQDQEPKDIQEEAIINKFCSDCSDGENNLSSEKAHLGYQNGSVKKKRRRKRQRKQKSMANENYQTNNLSEEYYEPYVNTKPNHIRFFNGDEANETDNTENNSMSFEIRQTNDNSLKVLNNETQQVITEHSNTESDPVIKEKINNTDFLSNFKTQSEIFNRFIDHNSERLNSACHSDSGIEKKEENDSKQSLSDLESLKEKIKHPRTVKMFLWEVRHFLC